MEQLFTPAAVLHLLAQIDELKGYNIGLTETLDDMLELTIGDSTYEIQPQSGSQIEVDDSVLNTVADTNIDAYENLSELGEVELTEPINSGIIKELAKTLLVGGMVRLTSKIIHR